MEKTDNDIHVTIVSRKQMNVEYVAKVLINEAHDAHLDAFCGKTHHILANYRKNVKITDK